MTIYDEIGGAEAVSAAVERFYERVLADPELAPYFEGVDVARLKGHQRLFIAVAIGGPERYVGRSMGEAHARLNIAPAHFDLVVGRLVDTLTALGVPAATIDTIGGALAPLKAEIAPDGEALAS
ncbi:group I truncated hemoglobin [Pseudonocardia pini]|uniref:group I truncated hemoglobin n=1 Tax=Pseudonocardia pini TaxID=2758030 RepID=UPI0015F014F5|nr:group 1 truncated hemoglobin [Pseudonocardia pini]